MTDGPNQTAPDNRFSKADLSRLGRVLRERRRARGLSLRALAGRGRLSVAAIRALEAGQVNPSLGTVLAVANALGADLDRLIEAARAGGDVALRRADGAAPEPSAPWPLGEAALSVALGRVEGDSVAPPPAANADHPVVAMVTQGSAILTLAGRQRLRIAAGDVLHAQPGIVKGLAGTGAGAARLLHAADTRRTGGVATGPRGRPNPDKRCPAGRRAPGET